MQLCNFTQADWDGKQWDKLKTCFATMNPDKWRNMDAVFDDVSTSFGARAADVWNVITKSYLKAGATDNDSVSWFRNSTTFFTAASFTQFIVKETELWRERGNPQVYVYQQTYASKLSHWGQRQYRRTAFGWLYT
ncbi:unnamed protein product, partial [Mesorhabditis spiculigera]